MITFVLSLSVFSQQKSTDAKSTQTKIKCAVMASSTVNIAKATKKHMYADYKGNRYFFCCSDCPKAFKADPKKYADSPHIKTPKSK